MEVEWVLDDGDGDVSDVDAVKLWFDVDIGGYELWIRLYEDDDLDGSFEVGETINTDHFSSISIIVEYEGKTGWLGNVFDTTDVSAAKLIKIEIIYMS